MIGVPTTVVKKNEVATLLKVDKSACRPAPARRVHMASEH
jgi:hypothetical protein